MHATILKVGYSRPPAMKVKSLLIGRNSKFLMPFDEIDISTLFIISFSKYIWLENSNTFLHIKNVRQTLRLEKTNFQIKNGKLIFQKHSKIIQNQVVMYEYERKIKALNENKWSESANNQMTN